MKTLDWHIGNSGAWVAISHTAGRNGRRFADVFADRPYEMTLYGLGVDGKVNVRIAGTGFKDVLQFGTIDEAKAFVESIFALESD